MGPGIDLETATAEPYHAMKADDDDACGRGRRGCCSAVSSLLSAENEVLPVAVLSVFAILLIVGLTYREPSYSVDLTGYEGIDPGRAARIVSPSFNVTLRMNDTCVDSARAAVTYSGVALSWARAEPRDCAEGRWAKDVEVVARGGGVGLSRRLRDRMASDWRSGGVELDVSVTMYREGMDIPRTFNGKVKMVKRST
ncbi:hypothetical protein C2845_PM07G24440 [Panicum miliaceum]|uniref:Late embryogenesis abundant protein LEA-2 subgroup domain-containing protein n=1 Tax=Panicum miliaceum TaxID=4540 RepID=A0A3L6SQ51_PANMI|nr:hypothetical protein C2845_PM07G24440 [Panicum miliaceum]